MIDIRMTASDSLWLEDFEATKRTLIELACPSHPAWPVRLQMTPNMGRAEQVGQLPVKIRCPVDQGSPLRLLVNVVDGAYLATCARCNQTIIYGQIAGRNQPTSGQVMVACNECSFEFAGLQSVWHRLVELDQDGRLVIAIKGVDLRDADSRALIREIGVIGEVKS